MIKHQYIFILLLLTTPFVVFLTSYPFYAKLCAYLIVHICIIIPLLGYLSRKFQWGNLYGDHKSYHHPFFLLSLATAMIYPALETMQMRPDMVSLWVNNKAYQFQGYLGMDEKNKVTSATNQGRLQAINNITSEDYIQLLNNFKIKLMEKQAYTGEMITVIENLKKMAQ